MIDPNLKPENILASLPRYYQGGPADRRLAIVYDLYEEGYQPSSTWTVIVDGERCTVQAGTIAGYNSWLFISEDDYMRIVSGRMNYSSAIWMGRVRIMGSWLAHEELNTYFKFPLESGIKMI